MQVWRHKFMIHTFTTHQEKFRCKWIKIMLFDMLEEGTTHSIDECIQATCYVGHVATVNRSTELCQTELKNTNNALPNYTNQKVLTVFPSSDDMIGTGHSMTGSVAAILSEPKVMKQLSS
jgi:hypothetical protein